MTLLIIVLIIVIVIVIIITVIMIIICGPHLLESFEVTSFDRARVPPTC